MINTIINDDCFNVFPDIKDKSIDCIIADLPYGTTACKWDIVLPLDKLWIEYKRAIKDNGAIVLFGSQPFTSILVNSNIDMFKYEIIWDKVKISNFMLAKKQILKAHENILLFYKNQCKYNPITTGKALGKFSNSVVKSDHYKNQNIKCKKKNQGIGYPKSILTFRQLINFDKDFGLHPTQKPVKLIEYLVKTYTDENDVVLDNTAGSCTLAVACIKTGRNFICIEKEKKYCDIGNKRIKEAEESISLLSILDDKKDKQLELL